MNSAVQKVWKYQRFEREHYAMSDPDIDGFYICGPFEPIHTRFASYGQALAAIGHALDEEWDKILALRGVANPRRWARIVFSTRLAGGRAAVLQLSEMTATGTIMETYFVLWRGTQDKADNRDAAIQKAKDLVEDATKDLEAGEKLDDNDKPEGSESVFVV